jgi:hypothetical protein
MTVRIKPHHQLAKTCKDPLQDDRLLILEDYLLPLENDLVLLQRNLSRNQDLQLSAHKNRWLCPRHVDLLSVRLPRLWPKRCHLRADLRLRSVGLHPSESEQLVGRRICLQAKIGWLYYHYAPYCSKYVYWCAAAAGSLRSRLHASFPPSPGLRNVFHTK